MQLARIVDIVIDSPPAFVPSPMPALSTSTREVKPWFLVPLSIDY